MADNNGKILALHKRWIRISHFVNPTQFWYVEDRTHAAILEVERTVQLGIHEYRHPENLTAGTKVAVFYFAWKKYIRAKVLHVKLSKEYILWAIDYGFPFLSALANIFNLPSHCAEDYDYVRLGGVNGLLPSVRFLDLTENCKDQMRLEASWNTTACQQLESLIYDAAAITFDEQVTDERGKVYGLLELIDCAGRKIKVYDHLIKEKEAVPHEDFDGKVALLREIPPWLSNAFEENIRTNFTLLSSAHCPIAVKEPLETAAYQRSHAIVNDWFARNEVEQRTANSLTPFQPRCAAQASDAPVHLVDTSAVETNEGRGGVMPNALDPVDFCSVMSTSSDTTSYTAPSRKYPKTPLVPRMRPYRRARKVRRLALRISPQRSASSCEMPMAAQECDGAIEDSISTPIEQELPSSSACAAIRRPNEFIDEEMLES